MADDESVQWRSSERHYTLTTTSFTKRELSQTELPRNSKTALIVTPRWSRERLQNEAAALQYIASATSIPVPAFLSLYEEHGLLHLQTTRVRGKALDEIDEAHAPAAVKQVNKQLESSILPQLRSLRHDALGSIDNKLPFIPLSRITYRDKRTSWKRKQSTSKRFVFCHCDLGQHNIFVDPVTFEITAIIDWEFAGFFPPEFELPLWWRPWTQPINDDEQLDRLIRWLDGPDEEVGQVSHDEAEAEKHNNKT